MNAEQLLAHYERVADVPDAIERLRRFVLDLAVRGKLVPQEPTDEPSSELLRRITTEKRKLVLTRKLRKPRELGKDDSVVAPFVIPISWQWARLDSVGAIVGGGTPSASDSENFTESGTGIPWLTPADLGGHEGLFISRGARDLSEKGLRSSSATLMPAGSVLFTSRAPIGYVAIATNPISTNQGFKSIVPYMPECSRFIATAMTAFAPGIDAKAPGTTFKEVSGKLVAAIPFPLPPLAEQHRIVAKVDELMALCDRLEAARAQREATRDRLTASTLARLNTPEPPASPDGDASKESSFQSNARFSLNVLPAITSRSDQIKQLRQTILNLAVRGKLVAQSPPDLESRKTRLEPSQPPGAPFDIPVGWRWERLASLGNLRGGGTPSKARHDFWVGPIPWVSPKDMKVDYVADAQLHVSEAAIAGSAANLIDPGSILFVVRGMILAHSFPVAITQCSVAINQDMKALTLKQPEMAEYVLRALKGLKPEMLKRVQRSSHGTCRLEGSDYSGFSIPIPPLAERHRIVAKVDELMSLCNQLEASLSRCDNTRSRVLNALLHEALRPSHENVIDFEAARTRLLERRQAVACRTVERLSRTKGFGRLRAVKPLYFAEAHCGVALGGEWGRGPFGPYDPWILSFESQATSACWFTRVERQTSNGDPWVEYTPGSKLGSKAKAAAEALGDRAAEFERVLALLADLNTDESEIVATLYAAWNDLLLEGKPVSDEIVICEFREHWGVARKSSFAPKRLQQWLDWMRQHRLTPTGKGPSTRHQATLL